MPIGVLNESVTYKINDYEKVFYFTAIILALSIISSCQKTYLCHCETINALYNPNTGIKTAHNVQGKNKEKAKSNCEGMSEKWDEVVTTCKMQ